MLKFSLPRALEAAETLPSPPGVAFEILRLASEAHADAEALAAVIKHDPVLTSKLLRTVNSPMYGLPGTIDSVSRAVALLGFRSVKELALAFSVADAMPLVDGRHGFDLSTFWLRSHLFAASARSTAARRDGLLIDVAFSTGLLANLGRLVLAHCLGEQYGKVLAVSSWPSTNLERKHLGFTSAAVTAGLLTKWGLPDHMATAAAYQHAPDALPPETDPGVMRLTHILAFARAIAEPSAGAGDDEALQMVVEAGERHLSLTVRETVDVLNVVRQDLAQSEAIIRAQLPDGISAEAVMDEAHAMVDRLIDIHRSNA